LGRKEEKGQTNSKRRGKTQTRIAKLNLRSEGEGCYCKHTIGVSTCEQGGFLRGKKERIKSQLCRVFNSVWESGGARTKMERRRNEHTPTGEGKKRTKVLVSELQEGWFTPLP